MSVLPAYQHPPATNLMQLSTLTRILYFETQSGVMRPAQDARYALTHTIIPEQTCPETYFKRTLVGRVSLHPSAKACLYRQHSKPFKHLWHI